MDVGDDLRAGERENVVVAPQVAAVLAQPLAPEAALIELVPLDHRAHGAVEQHDALPEEALETLDARAALGLIGRLERVGRRDRARRRGQLPRGLAIGAHLSWRRVRGVPAGAHPKASWRAAPAARATGRSPSA